MSGQMKDKSMKVPFAILECNPQISQIDADLRTEKCPLITRIYTK